MTASTTPIGAGAPGMPGPPTFVKPGAARAAAAATAGAGAPAATTAPPVQPPPPTGPPVGGQAPPAPPAFVKPSLYDGPPAPRRYGLAALALALFAGLAVAEQAAGLALALLCVGIAAAAWTLPSDRRGPFTAGTLVAAGVLGAVPVFRDSEWVTSLSLLGALSLASIAVAGTQTWRELAASMFQWFVKLFPAPAVFFGQGIKRASSRRWSQAGPVLRGLALATLLVLVFGALFSAADAEFEQLVHDLFDWDLDVQSIVVRLLIFGFVLALGGALWLVSATRKDRPTKEATTRLGRTEWTIALCALVVLFAGFVLLQLPEAFGGDDIVQFTEGLTYADNARMGFVQLTVAAILTLAVVMSAAHHGPSGDVFVRLLSGALCLLTVVVLVSALHRLGLYTDAYGATRTRFSLHKLMYWLGAVLLLVVVLGGLRRTAWLPRTIVAVSALFAIGVVALNPDARVAERNVARYELTRDIDVNYLGSLSADAMRQLGPLPADLRACAAAKIQRKALGGPGVRDTPLSFNISRAQARDVVDGFAALSPTEPITDRSSYSCDFAVDR